MKRIWLFALLIMAVAGASAQVDGAGSKDILLDRVVALVNDSVITRLELDAEVRFAVIQLGRPRLSVRCSNA